MDNSTCSHLNSIKVTDTDIDVCQECLASGDEWVHLRMCTQCGHVGCCNSSKNKHATKHFEQTNHPIMQSAEKDENWKWCYIDEDYLV